MSLPRWVFCGVAVLLVGASAACSSSASLRARPPRTVQPGQIVDASATAALTGKPVSLMVPSGRVDLVLSAAQAAVPARSVDHAAPLAASKGTQLVGVSWILQRAAYPDSPNRQLASPIDIFGKPRPTRLWLVTDGTRHEIPRMSDLTKPVDRPSTAVWVSVPAGVRTWQFQLAYDGVTQTVDARTGHVSAGPAAPLYRPLPLQGRGTCVLGRAADSSCLIDYAVGYPYVDGAGWAPDGRTWALLAVDLNDNVNGARSVTVAGAKPRNDVGDNVTPLSPFLVPADARSLPIHGRVTVENNDGHHVFATVSGHLTGPAS